MKKATMKAILTLIEGNNTPEAVTVRNEVTAELNKGAEKAAENKAVYDAMREKVFEVLRGVADPVSAAEIAAETGYTTSKISRGLNHEWKDDVVIVKNGRSNLYSLK